MISRHETVVIFSLLIAFFLTACAAPQAPTESALDPAQAQRLLDRQDELAEQLVQVRSELDEIRGTLQNQQDAIAALERRKMGAAEPKVEREELTAGTAADLSPTEVYRKSFAAYASGDYDRAIEGFELFVENFPESRYAGNAYYWLGESYFSRQDYSKAISAFRSLAEEFPQSSKVPEGLFKVALSYSRMDQPEQAEQVMQILRERYPKSRAAQRTLETAIP